MGLRINTNVNSIVALRHLALNDRNQTRSLERLSTGLRINRAADDPSGLIVSEQLRGQIRSLEQGAENSQNAANLISIVDAALQQLSERLVDIQESVIFALNTGGASPAQIAAEQSRVDQAIAAVDRIAATTRFADRNLLNGSLSFYITSDRPSQINDMRMRTVVFPSNAPSRDLSFTVSRLPQRARIQITSAVTVGTTILRVFGPRGTEDVTVGPGASSVTIAAAVNSVAGFTGVFASGVSQGNLDIFSEDFGLSQAVRIEILDGSISGASTTVQVLDDTGALSTTGVPQKPLIPGNVIYDRGLDGQITFEGQVFTGVGRQFNILTRTASVGFSLDAQLIGPAMSGSTYTVTVANTGLNFQLGGSPLPTDRLSFGIDTVNSAMLGFEPYRDRIAESEVGISSAAPQSQWMLYGGYLNSVITGKANDLTVNPRNALGIIRSALTQVATLRGDLGAVQADNILPNIDNVSVAAENLQSTLSSIRDLDFAKESADFVKSQVLFQSNIGVLSATNTLPQAVLTLLGGR
jgi:flagellin